MSFIIIEINWFQPFRLRIQTTATQ